MKSDPNGNDAIFSSVGDDFGFEVDIVGTVGSIDKCVVYSMECLVIPDKLYWYDTIQSTTSLHLLERKLMNICCTMGMVLWERMDIFMQPIILVQY